MRTVTPTPGINWLRFTTEEWLAHRDQDITQDSLVAARSRLQSLGFAPFWDGNQRYWKRGA